MNLIQKLIDNQAVLLKSQFELSAAHRILCSEVVGSTERVSMVVEKPTPDELAYAEVTNQAKPKDFEMPPAYNLNALNLHEIAACAVILEGKAFNEAEIQNIAQPAIKLVKSKDAPEILDKIHMIVNGLPDIYKLNLPQRYELCVCLYHDWDNRKATKKVPNPHKDFAQNFIREALGQKVIETEEHVIPDDAPVETPSVKTLDYVALRKEVTQRILQLAKSGYRDDVVAILEEFGAKKVPELRDTQLPAVLEMLEEQNCDSAC